MIATTLGAGPRVESSYDELEDYGSNCYTTYLGDNSADSLERDNLNFLAFLTDSLGENQKSENLQVATATLVLQKTVDNTMPSPGEPFNYTLDMACNSTSRDCESTMVVDCLDPDLVFIDLSDPLPDGVSSAEYDPATHCVTILFDASNCMSCSPDGINTDEDDFAQGSTVQILIQVMFPLGTFDGTTAENTIIGTSDNAGNPTASSNTSTAQGGTPGQTGCNAIPSYANVSGSHLVPGGQWESRVRATNLSPNDISDYVITTTVPDEITFTHIIGPDLNSGLCTNIDVYYERSDMPGTWVFHKTIDSCSEEEITAADLGLPAGVEPTAFQFDYGTLEGDGSWNPDTWTNIHENEIRIFGLVDSNIPVGTPISYCNTVEGSVGGVDCFDSICDFDDVDDGNDVVQGSKKIFDDDFGFQIGDTYTVGLTYTNPVVMLSDIEGAYMLDVLPHCMEYVPGSWEIAWGEENIDNQVPVVNTGNMPDGREYIEFVWDETLGNNFIIPGTGQWTSFQVRFDVMVTGSCSAGIYQNEYYFGTTGNDPSTNCAGDIPITNLQDYANAATYVTNGELCLDLEEVEIVLPPGSAGLDSHKSTKGALDTDYNLFPDVGQTYAGSDLDYRICLDNPNSVPVDDIVIIDIFPHLGDTEILSPDVPRGSEWAPFLTAPISVPTGFTVEYTTVANPCRDEMAGPSDPLPFPTGCAPANWSTSAPADLTTVTGIRIDYGSTTINQGEQFCLEWSMTVPEDAPLNSTAFNSFAFLVSNANTGAPLLPSEPIKVGTDIVPPPCEVFQVDAGPVVSFCEGTEGQLQANTTFGLAPFEYTWSGPGGFSSSLADPMVIEPGTYSLSVEDASGCVATDMVEVYAFVCDDASACNFVDQFNTDSYWGSDGSLSWSAFSWDESGDNNSSNSGQVQVLGGQLIMANGNDTQPSIQRQVNLDGYTSATLLLDLTTQGALDADDQFIIEIYDGTTWHTIFSYDGSSPMTVMPGLDISAYISADTEIRITLTSGFNESGEGLIVDNVRVDVACVCEVVAEDLEYCQGGSIVLSSTASGTGVLSYNWSPAGDLDDSTSATPTATPSGTTTYMVTVTDELGCTAVDELIVTSIDTTEVFCERYRIRDENDVWGPWIPMDSQDCTIELCELNGLQDIRFDGGPNIDSGWVWTDEDGNVDSEVDEIVTFSNIGLDDAGIYTGTFTNAAGCPSTVTFDVVVHPNVGANVVSIQHDQCLDGSGEFTITINEGTGPFTINWQNDMGGEEGSTILNEVGDYVVSGLNGGSTYCIDVVDALGCSLLP